MDARAAEPIARPVAPPPVAGRAGVAGTVPSARERLLCAASELFCHRGFGAVGVDAVVEAAGTAKTTLYKLFGSKEALVEAVLEREGLAWREWFIGGLDTGIASPRERLDRIFPMLRDWFAGERFYGCAFINAVGEHDKADDRMRDLALAHKRIVIARIRELLAEAGASEPDRLSHQVGILIDGAIVAALVTRNAEVGTLAAGALGCVLDRHLGAARSASARPGRVRRARS